MEDTLTVKNGSRIAYEKTPGKAPGVMFLGGFHSDMTGKKVTALEAHCRAVGRAFVRFDYTGHGASSGLFEEGVVSAWAQDAVAVLDEVTKGPQVLVGSSMGGWVMLLATLARPARVCGLVGVAAAPDFTEDLIWDKLSTEARHEIETVGKWIHPSDSGEDSYPITQALIEDGRRHLLLRGPVAIGCPVRLIHGMQDESVPWKVSKKLMAVITSEDTTLTLVKGGDHRLSEASDIVRLTEVIDALCLEIEYG